MPENRRARMPGSETWAWAAGCAARGPRCLVGQVGAGGLPDRFADGTAAHARDLARAGFDAYSGLPQVPLRVFFISLVLLDPLVVVLAALVLPAGIWLAAIVMVLDVAANTAGNWFRIVRDSAPHSGAYPAR